MPQYQDSVKTTTGYSMISLIMIVTCVYIVLIVYPLIFAAVNGVRGFCAKRKLKLEKAKRDQLEQEKINCLKHGLKQIQAHQNLNIKKMKNMGDLEQKWYIKQNQNYKAIELKLIEQIEEYAKRKVEEEMMEKEKKEKEKSDSDEEAHGAFGWLN